MARENKAFQILFTAQLVASIAVYITTPALGRRRRAAHCCSCFLEVFCTPATGALHTTLRHPHHSVGTPALRGMPCITTTTFHTVAIKYHYQTLKYLYTFCQTFRLLILLTNVQIFLTICQMFKFRFTFFAELFFFECSDILHTFLLNI